eukprot:365995-Chlamydomonas_euryale.AAC.6
MVAVDLRKASVPPACLQHIDFQPRSLMGADQWQWCKWLWMMQLTSCVVIKSRTRTRERVSRLDRFFRANRAASVPIRVVLHSPHLVVL